MPSSKNSDSTKNKLAEWVVDRIYGCSDKECEAIIQAKQLAGDNFLLQCPFCEKDTLLLQSADCGLTILVNTKKPNTVGMISQENTQRMEREGTLPPAKEKVTPWWRDGKKKVNFDILKNPKRYIETGKT